MSYTQHINASQGIVARCAVVTLSDTRTESTDTSGQRIRQLLDDAKHTIAHYSIIKDDPQQLSDVLDKLLADKTLDTILTNGGTGISRRDNTITVIERKLTIPLPGFGELFRMLSYEQIQSGAMLSRATAGVIETPIGRKLIFAMPGSTKAVELAMTKLILPELKHLRMELRK